jgi:hypothetical protein
VRDVLDAGDAYLHSLSSEELEELERRRLRKEKQRRRRRGGPATAAEEEEEKERGCYDTTGGGGDGGDTSSSSSSSTSSSASSSSTSSSASSSSSPISDLGIEDLTALAETGRKMYLKAPKTWAPVLAAAVARPEAVAMAASVAKGAAERATCDNLKLVTRGVIRCML